MLDAALRGALELPKDFSSLSVELFNRGGYAEAPFAYVTPVPPQGTDLAVADATYEALCKTGVMILGVQCNVKMRRPSKRERQAAAKAKEAAKKAKAATPRPAWRPGMLGKFKMRASTLDQQEMVAQLGDDLQDLIKVYLRQAFPSRGGDDSLVVRALVRVVAEHPKSLRVKELFETMETFKQVEPVISKLRRLEGDDGVDHIFDMACGHGLLGILLAHRFAECKVTCVDLVKRGTYANYVETFSSCGVELSNVVFLEADMSTAAVPPRSFLACIHACNEANVACLSIAKKAKASYGCMPCCIREGLYGITCRHLDDDVRHALLVGSCMKDCGAHIVRQIDRRITNRHLIFFGGYLPLLNAGSPEQWLYPEELL